MYVQLNAVVVDSDPTNRQELTNFLATFGVAVVAQVGSCDGLASMVSRADSPQLVIINLDPNASDNIKKLGTIPRSNANCSFFVMSQVLDPNLLMEAMAAGVREFIPLPIQEAKFSAALERVANQHGMGKKASIINVIPTIGGCGSTTIACNVAASLAAKGKSAIIDLDLFRGAVAQSFDTRPRYTISDLMESAERVDKQVIDNAFSLHRSSNLSILARPELPEDTQRVTQSGFNRLLNVASRVFENVVIDSMMSTDPVYTSAIQAADLNIITMQLNIPSCKNAERFLGAIRRMGIESSKIKIVVNRFVKKGWDIDPEEVERALGLKITWMVPNDFKNAIAAINYGEPVVLRAPRCEMSLALSGLADQLFAREAKKKAA